MVEIDLTRDSLITPFGHITLRDRYLLDDETSPQQAYARACTAFADDAAHAQRLYEYVSKQWFGFATPLLSNGGTKRGLPISCFLNSVPDSREGITDHYTESGWLSSVGGGIGAYYGDIRSNGQSTRFGSASSGLIPFIKPMDSIVLAFAQGKTRRASYAAYTNIDHPEIEEFVTMRKPQGGDPYRKCLNLHHGLMVSDKFMQLVENCLADRDYPDGWELIDPHAKVVTKVISARALWRAILESRIETGEPYLIFSDTVDRAFPEEQKRLGLRCINSNLCVAPETQLLTNTGYRAIADLVDQPVEVWNGTQWSPTIVRKTGINVPLITVSLSNGMKITCTPYHKFYVKNTYAGKAVEVRAVDLKTGDKLEKFDLPADVTDSGAEAAWAYAHGFFCGDGTYGHTPNGSRVQHFRLYGEKKQLFSRLHAATPLMGSGQPDSIDRLNYVAREALPEKFCVPINYSVNHKIEWFAGWCDADGTLTVLDGYQGLQVGSVEPEFLREVHLMLQTLGVHSTISVLHEARSAELPNGHGGSAYYDCQKVERLMVGTRGLNRLIELGFAPSRLKVAAAKTLKQRSKNKFVQVLNVEDLGRRDDTYCVNEPLAHKAVFNGILTGNCSEITLSSGIDIYNRKRTAVCCLSSVNLARYSEWGGEPCQQFVEDLLRMLDNALTTFITEAPGPLADAVYSAQRERSIGLGAMGFHSYLQKNNIALDDPAAAMWNEIMFRRLRACADQANATVAAERGACPDSIDGGDGSKRWMHMLAVAPNASSSIICGQVSPGIEPHRANAFTAKTLSGSAFVKNQELQVILADMGRDDDATWSNIVVRRGSVQHLDFLSEQQKRVFLTAMEVDQMVLVRLAAQRAPHICQASATNLFFAAGSHVSKVMQAHIAAWKLGVKSLYYCRSESIRAAENVGTQASVNPNAVAISATDIASLTEESCAACSG